MLALRPDRHIDAILGARTAGGGAWQVGDDLGLRSASAGAGRAIGAADEARLSPDGGEGGVAFAVTATPDGTVPTTAIGSTAPHAPPRAGRRRCRSLAADVRPHDDHAPVRRERDVRRRVQEAAQGDILSRLEGRRPRRLDRGLGVVVRGGPEPDGGPVRPGEKLAEDHAAGGLIGCGALQSPPGSLRAASTSRPTSQRTTSSPPGQRDIFGVRRPRRPRGQHPRRVPRARRAGAGPRRRGRRPSRPQRSRRRRRWPRREPRQRPRRASSASARQPLRRRERLARPTSSRTQQRAGGGAVPAGEPSRRTIPGAQAERNRDFAATGGLPTLDHSDGSDRSTSSPRCSLAGRAPARRRAGRGPGGDPLRPGLPDALRGRRLRRARRRPRQRAPDLRLARPTRPHAGVGEQALHDRHRARRSTASTAT